MGFWIYGWSTATQSQPEGKRRCGSCGGLTFHELVESHSNLELFFMPVYTFGQKSWHRCKACGFESDDEGARSEGSAKAGDETKGIFGVLLLLVAVVAGAMLIVGAMIVAFALIVFLLIALQIAAGVFLHVAPGFPI